MKRFLKIWHESFPYYLSDDKKNTWLIAGLSVFMTLFLIILLPKEWIWIMKFSLIGAIIFVVLYPSIVWAPKLFPKVINPDHWTIGKYISYTILQLIAIGVVTSIVTHLFQFHPTLSFWMNLKYSFIDMVVYGTISVVLFTFVLRNVMLKNNLKRALQANAELEKIRTTPSPQVTNEDDNIIIQSDTSETAELRLQDLLYIEASDNYSTVFWKDNYGLQKKMLRVNLKNVEAQLDNRVVIRCHRSFMVNVNAITHVEGNTNGYRLSIRDSDVTIPVSRGKGREVIERIGGIRKLGGLR
jgi:hypothetical protein